ncbi:MAG: glutaminyl-peptide cyclotransferase [Cellulophaga sp.]
MNILKLLTLGTLAIILNACGGGNTAASDLFVIKFDGNKKQLQQNQSTGISITNKKEKTITKVTYSINGKEVILTDNKINLNLPKVGAKTLKAVIEYEGGSAEINKKFILFAKNRPALYTYTIINEYPHDIKAFTQGLEFHNDTLYEGTGKISSLRQVDYKTGEIIKNIDLDKSIFGEGITILKDKLYQLTWQNKIGFIYDINKFEKIDRFAYGKSKEGWGLCNDGKVLYKSDGTEKIWTLNPDTLIEEDYIEIYTHNSKLIKINELEYVDGKIYANTWQPKKEVAVIINPSSGAVEGVINFAGLKSKVTQHKEVDVLNGIAYHPTRKTFFITGKYWDKMFEVKIEKK